MTHGNVGLGRLGRLCVGAESLPFMVIGFIVIGLWWAER